MTRHLARIAIEEVMRDVPQKKKYNPQPIRRLPRTLSADKWDKIIEGILKRKN